MIGAENPRHLENKTMISSDETDAKSDAIADPSVESSEGLEVWVAQDTWSPCPSVEESEIGKRGGNFKKNGVSRRITYTNSTF